MNLNTISLRALVVGKANKIQEGTCDLEKEEEEKRRRVLA
jgi:hypothetical protein